MIENLQAHYGFTLMPFGSAVPVAALFGSAAHKEAVARLRWLISARGDMLNLAALDGGGDPGQDTGQDTGQDDEDGEGRR